MSGLNCTVSGATIEDVWQEALDLAAREGIPTYSRFGLAFDLPNLTIAVNEPDEGEVVAGYAYPALISDYYARLFGDTRDNSLLHRRMHEWGTGPSSAIDQLEQIESELRAAPDSRAAVFALWAPGDLATPYPASPMAGTFRILGNKLHLFTLARSLDLWLGAVPELLVLARMLHRMAGRLEVVPGSMALQCWSGHLYEADRIRVATAGHDSR